MTDKTDRERNDIDMSRKRLERLRRYGLADYLHMALLARAEQAERERDEALAREQAAVAAALQGMAEQVHERAQLYYTTTGTAFFFKQWGAWLPFSQCRSPEQREAVSATTIRSNKTGDGSQTYFGKSYARHPDGHLVTSATPGIRPEQINRVGKARAGRLLDGREWNGMPGE